MNHLIDIPHKIHSSSGLKVLQDIRREDCRCIFVACASSPWLQHLHNYRTIHDDDVYFWLRGTLWCSVRQALYRVCFHSSSKLTEFCEGWRPWLILICEKVLQISIAVLARYVKPRELRTILPQDLDLGLVLLYCLDVERLFFFRVSVTGLLPSINRPSTNDLNCSSPILLAFLIVFTT